MKILSANKMYLERVALSRALERRGHTVEAVTDGDELLERVRAGASPDVVITDTDSNVARVGGLEVLRSLRADNRFRVLPIIVYSANSSIGPAVERLGGVFVSKVLTPTNLFSALDTIATDTAKRKRG